MKRSDFSTIMRTAWQFVRTTGKSLSECLKLAWANFKLVRRMKQGIVKFYFQKVDGSIREAWGTLSDTGIPISNREKKERAKNDFTQVYFDTEKQEFRSYKKLNLIY
ncbi:SH3 beta-barrel fold-containing protein [Dysgonomonas macrotermitis]|uniref:DUF2693 domain-containing protein n=1 Tax=Dysgonomonas macrotermitis TaxID=1346286 RepID=A0A1M5GKR5_9BACT|nr:SH3 beta-barrel fold-containing protein [Dysgonomonas macrotermitis]SHG04297.1 Protein of unknown function [Dysgonomonas macrotermitis]